MKKCVLHGIVLVIMASNFGMAAVAQRVLGGYSKASTTDERVVAAAEFAVSKQAESQEGLTLVSVERAETQSVSGTNYRLCLKVSLDDESQEVKVVVFVSLNQEYSLKSWTVENCSGN